nr:unnamed protein product [Callosobruchus analis]
MAAMECSELQMEDFSFGNDLMEINRDSSSFCEQYNENLSEKHVIASEVFEESEKSTEPQDNTNALPSDEEEYDIAAAMDEEFDSIDPSYVPDDDESSSSDVNDSAYQEEKENESIGLEPNQSVNETSALNMTGLEPCKDENMFVDQSLGKNGCNKANFCCFCLTKQKQISRHLENKHANEKAVQVFLQLPKKSSERRKCIEKLRREGNYMFNTVGAYNDGELIVARRPNAKFSRTAEDFKLQRLLFKSTLRIHFRKCAKGVSKNHRSTMIISRRVMGRIHEKAIKKVRHELFPPLREDQVVRAIRYDELVIIYANKMVLKYKNSRYFEMIRQRVRLIGRFLLRIKSINKRITDLTSVFDPMYIDDTLKAIYLEAGLDLEKDIYKTPTVASNIGTLLKQTGNILVAESIKNMMKRKRRMLKTICFC